MTASAVQHWRAAAPDEAASAYLLPLGGRLDPSVVGGKAATLARLTREGISVPTGLVLTTAVFARWIEASGLEASIAALWSPERPTPPRRLAAVAGDIRELVYRSRMPADVDTALDLAFSTLAAHVPLIVRSSAVGEDGRRASFAGQLDSVLHVTSRTELDRAVRLCWASYWSERALFYRQARRAALDGLALIIQHQVPASTAGVLFTCDPQDAGALTIEYCRGLADDLVSGRVDPDRVTVPRAAVHDGTANLPATLAASGLAALSLHLEQMLGGPQDIEWAIDRHGKLWIVQARPITTMAATPAPAAELVYWSNANINENFPAPVSPLLYSIASEGYYHYFRNLGLAFGISRRRLAAMDQPLRSLIGAQGARLYYNLTNIHAVLRMAPFGEALARAFNQFVGARDVAPVPSGAVTWRDRAGHVAQGVELFRIGLATTWQYLFVRRRIESFERTADVFAARTRPDRLAARSLDELADDLRRFMDIRRSAWKNASLADAAAMVSYAMLERATTWVPNRDPGLHNRLLRALPGVPSGQPPLRLWEIAALVRDHPQLASLFATSAPEAVLEVIRRDREYRRVREAFEAYLDDWGFRSTSELMLTAPTLQEDPRPLIELIARYVTSAQESPADIIARQASERRTDTRRVIRSLLGSPIRAVLLWAALRATQRAITFRERARLKQALLYTRCRHVVRDIGRRLVPRGVLANEDDIFMLRWHEIDELLAGREMFAGSVRDLIHLRKQSHAALSSLTPPDSFSLPRSRTWTSSDRMPEIPLPDVSDPDTARVLRGVAASSGRVTGRAAVLADIGDAPRLTGGDVLVTRQTDPGWAPVFGLISGLVIERGGLLSHGAVIAREFGVPCIAGVPQATLRIAHGAIVTVDGNAGVCTIHDGLDTTRTEP